ncbi:M20 peptidase aminoacylase family protein [Halalkalibacter krulwichiae]|uniref:Putative hydrolase YxeP n=1 Tax=Halalkalibacter krulwichiae TaxID=199441 RepID=A0A1X9MFP4_9BACI|nr:M20 peptidase aminoacylase family protein [Halalkalibacter krulwichiae]ARK32277.1 putative hydrolase YxeP [Halalkalibacter krulwichiae]
MKQIVESLHDRLLQIFDHLHSHPELSWKEEKTTAYIKQLLEQEGVVVRTFPDCTGLVAEIGSGMPVVAVRADIDALGQEVNGVIQANHSCAHDAHMTIAIGVLLTLRKQELPKGTVRFIFQPAEEVGNGALKMVEKQVVDDVDYLYGVHVRPVQELKGGQATPAIIHGAGLFFEGKIIGEDAHGARPHLAVNAIEVGSAIVEQLKGIYADPQVPHSVKLTKFQAGGENANIIPGSAVFSIDLRAQSNEVLDQLQTKVEHVIEAIGKLYDVEIRLDVLDYVPAAEVHKQAESMMEAAINEVIGQERFVGPIVTSGGDDFHYYTIKRPHLKATMLGLGANLTPGLHHPYMTFEREAIFTGVEILAQAVVKTLKN